MKHWCFALLVLPLALLAAAPAEAGLDTTAEHAILMDAATGQILWEKDAHTPVPPASMSKLMTLEMLFQRLKDGRVKLNDTFYVSHRARYTFGSRMFLREGSRVAVEDLIRGIIIQSGNDAAVTVAEALGGSVENFATMMNARARQLGLKDSHFVNPDGLPDPPGQRMSAYDLATLARHIINDYPKYYHYFGERSFAWNNIQQPNRNLVLEKFPGADGLKTGHTDEAGYGVTASAVKNGERLILVLNGLRYPDLDAYSDQKADWIAEQRRAEAAAQVFEMAFREYRSYSLFKAGETIDTVKVWGGSHGKVPVTAGKALAVAMPVDARAGMKVTLNTLSPLRAPIAKGQQVGTLKVTAPGFAPLEVPVYATEKVGRAGPIGRIWMGILGLLHHGAP